MSKLIAKLCLAVAVPTALFGAAEGVARAVRQPSDRGRLFIATTDRSGGAVWQREPARNVPWYPPYHVAKPPGTFRVACLGGSTVVGVPFPEQAFPAVLQQILRVLRPNVRIEVIACGVGGMYSDGEMRTLKEVLALAPDVVVLYSGHNEFHPGNLAVLFERASHPMLASTRDLLARSAIHASLVELLLGDVKPNESLGRQTPDHRPIDGPEYGLVVDHFRSFLRDFAATCDRRRITCVLCTAVSNLRDFAPMADVFGKESTAEERARCRSLWQQSIEQSVAGRFDEALRLVDEAAAIDPTPASIPFARGHALLGLGRADEARKQFRLARDHDGRLNRASTDLNLAVREVAAESGAWVADVEARFSGLAPNGIVGDEWILDNVHPNLAGQALIARVIAETLARAGVLITPAELAQLPPAPPSPVALTPAETEERIAFENLKLALEKGGGYDATRIARLHYERLLKLEDRASGVLGLGLLDALDRKPVRASERMRQAHAMDPRCFEPWADAAARSKFVKAVFKACGVMFEGSTAVLDPDGGH